MEQTKIHINIKSGEISIEGSEEFVSNQIDNLEDIVSLIQMKEVNIDSDEVAEDPTLQGVDDSTPQANSSSSKPSNNGDFVVPDVFGEWLQMFKDEINDQDKALITAYYVQQDSENNDFKTAQINKSLKDHGIKLTNTSTTLKQIEKKKLIFQTRKVGSLSYKRVSDVGVKYLKDLLT